MVSRFPESVAFLKKSVVFCVFRVAFTLYMLHLPCFLVVFAVPPFGKAFHFLHDRTLQSINGGTIALNDFSHIRDGEVEQKQDA